MSCAHAEMSQKRIHSKQVGRTVVDSPWSMPHCFDFYTVLPLLYSHGHSCSRCLLAIDAETCGTALRAYLPRMSSRLRSFWSTPALVTVGLARSAHRRGRKAPPSPEPSVKSRRLKHYGRRDILAAFGIANNEGHGHQLPSMQIIDRDVASQISVVEALPRFALNQDNGCFRIVHARTSTTLWGRCGPTPANEKNIRAGAASAQLGATHARDQGLSGCFLAKICARPLLRVRPCAPRCGVRAYR